MNSYIKSYQKNNDRYQQAKTKHMTGIKNPLTINQWQVSNTHPEKQQQEQ